MAERFKPLTEGLGPRFTELEHRAQLTLELAGQVRAALPGPEKEHVVSASYRGDTLVVLTDSAAWCPYVRYAETTLRSAFRNAGLAEFTRLKVKVGHPG